MAMHSAVNVSTEEVVCKGFAPHGLVKIRFEDDILFYEATGPFNLELVNALALAQQNMLNAVNPQHAWASVTVMRGSMLASLEAFERYNQIMHMPGPASLRPAAMAYVVGPDVEGGTFMLPRYAAIHESVGCVFKSFERADEAVAWARAFVRMRRDQAGSGDAS